MVYDLASLHHYLFLHPPLIRLERILLMLPLIVRHTEKYVLAACMQVIEVAQSLSKNGGIPEMFVQVPQIGVGEI